jgi:hypothetical protein
MTEEEAQMSYGSEEEGIVDVTVRFAITPKGREVLSRWL